MKLDRYGYNGDGCTMGRPEEPGQRQNIMEKIYVHSH